MKKISLIFAFFIFTILAIGQAPDKINYQGVLRDANGNVVANKSISGSIVISDGSSNYTFSITGISTNSYGLFNFKIGPINNSVDWSSSSVTITSTITYIDANNLSQTITNSTNPDQLVSVPYALFANQLQNYPKTGTDGYYLKWDASANNGNGSWVAAPVNSGSTLPTNATVNQVLTWDGSSWVAQDNDGYEANTDDQTSLNLIMDPPTDFDNDPMTDENTLNEALNVLNTKITGSNSSSVWINSTTSGEETDVITSDQLAQVGIGNDYAREKLDVNGNIIVQNDDANSINPNESKLSIYEPTIGLNGAAAETSTDKIELVSSSNLNTINLINDDEGNNIYGKFEIVSKSNPSNTLQSNSEFFIRQDVNYNPNATTASYHNLIYANGLSQNIGFHTDDPGTSFSIGAPTSSTKGPIVSIGQNYGVFNSAYTYTDIPGNSLIVEGKTGIGTMYPQGKLDVAGAVRIGSTYSGDQSITDQVNGLIVEGSVGIGTNSPNTNYKLDVDGKVQISSVATDGGILKIGSTSQTSGDAVLIASVTGQNALKIRSGDFHIEDGQQNSTSKFSVIGSSGNTSIQGTLNTTGATTLSSSLDVGGNTSIQGTLNTTGATTLASSLNVGGNTSMQGTLNTTGATTLASTLDVGGDFSVATNQFIVQSNGNTYIDGLLITSGNTSIDGNFDVATDKFTVQASTGNTSIKGDLNMNSNYISNVVDPFSDQDAATKKYVDDQITNSETTTAYTAGNDISSASLSNNIIQLEDEIDVLKIKASTNSGISILDDDNNLGVFIKDGGNVGIGSNSPTSKLQVNGHTKINNGYLSVGGNTTLTTREDVEYSSINSILIWSVENGSATQELLGISLPSNATNIKLKRVQYFCDLYHEDNNEYWSIRLQIDGTDQNDTKFDSDYWGSPSNGEKLYHPIVDLPLGGISVNSNSTFKIKATDEDCFGCGSDALKINTIIVKLTFEYDITAQNGDIVASGRIYANSTTSVGDVAEYFPVNDGVEVGNIIAAESGKSNSYKLADEPYCNHLVGVISKEPSIVLNDPNEGPPVGLTGRVNVKLVKSDLLIKSGDFITSSSQKGLGQKATHEGPVIGYAVRDQNLGEDFVEILLQPGRYYKPKQNEEAIELKTENSKEIENLNSRLELLEKMILEEANKN